MDWTAEIIELHDTFQRWFNVGDGDLERFESTMDPAFTIVPPSGEELSGSAIVDAVKRGRGRSPSLTIDTFDHHLLLDEGDVIIARYVERQAEGGHITERTSTVVFRRDESMPNGLRWCAVHETMRGD